MADLVSLHPLPQVQIAKRGVLVHRLKVGSVKGLCLIFSCLVLFLTIAPATSLAQAQFGKIATQLRSHAVSANVQTPPPGTINTVAGGGPPNNSLALSDAIGFPNAVAEDAAGNFYIADINSSRVFEVDSSGKLTIVAGTGSWGYSGDGGPATQAQLSDPFGIFVDASGDIFIADTSNNRIRKVTNGVIQTVAGNGTRGYSGDGGPATQAHLAIPYGVSVDPWGDIFIADTYNQRIRCVLAVVGGCYDLSHQYAVGDIMTVAGDGTQGFSGDGGPATQSELNGPAGVFVDPWANIFFIADTRNCIVREVEASTGSVYIYTVAGTAPGTSGPQCGYSGDGGLATQAALNSPYGVSVDPGGDLFIADSYNSAIREVALAATGKIQTVAGNGTWGYSGDGGPATQAELNDPHGVLVDTKGNLFIADFGNYRIREVAAGIIETVAGNGTLEGDRGPATDAVLNWPLGVFVDGAGDIFIADCSNGVVREVLAKTGDIQTVAGMPGSSGYEGDGRLATQELLNCPSGVFVDGNGNIFIADKYNARIRKVTNGVIQTVAGDGKQGYSGDGGPATQAELYLPAGVFVDANGNLFIADQGNCIVREVVASSGDIHTVAGTAPGTSGPQCGYSGDNIPATQAELSYPLGVSLDSVGNIFIADWGTARTRVVNTQTSPITIATVKVQPGDIATVAGNGNFGYSGDGGPATQAQLSYPGGVFVDASGNIFIADTGNNTIRKVTNGVIQTVAGDGKQGYSGDGGPATQAELYIPAGVFVDAAGNLFIADTFNERIREVTTAETTTTTTLSITATPSSSESNVGSQVTCTATVAHTAGSATPTGTVKFVSGSATLWTGTLDSSGKVSWSTSGLAVGAYSIVADYSGDANYAASSSSVANLDVVDFKITANPTTVTVSAPGQSGQTTLTIAPLSGFNETLSYSCSGLPSGATCTFATASATTETLTIQTTAASAARLDQAPLGHNRELLYALLLPGFLGLVTVGDMRKKKWRWMAFAFALTLLILWLPACGGGSSSSSTPPPSGGTPTGTSQVTVTAATSGAGPLTHQVQITLTVQ